MRTYILPDTTIRILGRVCMRESIRAIVVHNVVHKARHQRSPYRPNVRGWQGKAKQTSDDDTMRWNVAATALPPPMQLHGRSERKARDFFGMMRTYKLSDTTIRI